MQHPLPSSLLPWRLICNSVRLRVLGNVHTLFLQCYTCAVTRVKKSLFSGNCQVGCCLLHVLQLGHHTPHKISASSGFNAFLCSTLAFFIVAMASHLQLCSIEGFGKRPYSFLQCYTCAVTHLVGQKLRLLSFPAVKHVWFLLLHTPFPLES